jgi:hypothetical protein
MTASGVMRCLKLRRIGVRFLVMSDSPAAGLSA